VEKIKNTYIPLLGNPEEKRPLGRPSRRWENNIKMTLEDTLCKDVDCVQLAQDRVQCWAVLNMVMKLRVSWNVETGRKVLKITFAGRK
jgi:hypothetical protein